MGHFIDDGQQVLAIVPARAGLWGELSIEYRPPVSSDLARYNDDAAKARASSDMAQLQAKFLAGKIVRWGADRAVTPEAIGAMHADLVDELWSAVLHGRHAVEPPHQTQTIREGN